MECMLKVSGDQEAIDANKSAPSYETAKTNGSHLSPAPLALSAQNSVTSLDNQAPTPIPTMATRLSSEKVPGNKEDIFISSDISLIEKRKMMKFFQTCGEWNASLPHPELASLSFREYVEQQGINPRFNLGISPKYTLIICTCLVLNLSQDFQKVTCVEGILRVQMYLKSLGKYGPGALLTAVYGCGSELSQAFCR
jgi:RAB protein geranylgeranyltransferase component A